MRSLRRHRCSLARRSSRFCHGGWTRSCSFSSRPTSRPGSSSTATSRACGQMQARRKRTRSARPHQPVRAGSTGYEASWSKGIDHPRVTGRSLAKRSAGARVVFDYIEDGIEARGNQGPPSRACRDRLGELGVLGRLASRVRARRLAPRPRLCRDRRPGARQGASPRARAASAAPDRRGAPLSCAPVRTSGWSSQNTGHTGMRRSSSSPRVPCASCVCASVDPRLLVCIRSTCRRATTSTRRTAQLLPGAHLADSAGEEAARMHEYVSEFVRSGYFARVHATSDPPRWRYVTSVAYVFRAARKGARRLHAAG